MTTSGNTSILITLSQDELCNIIQDSVKNVIVNSTCYKQHENTLQSEIIDTKELIARLRLSEPTIIRYRKKGIIPYLQIGSAIRYEYQKVLEALEKRKGGRK